MALTWRAKPGLCLTDSALFSLSSVWKSQLVRAEQEQSEFWLSYNLIASINELDKTLISWPSAFSSFSSQISTHMAEELNSVFVVSITV